MGYLSIAKRWNWLYKEFSLSMLNKEKSEQLGAYRRFVSEKDPEGILRIEAMQESNVDLTPLL